MGVHLFVSLPSRSISAVSTAQAAVFFFSPFLPLTMSQNCSSSALVPIRQGVGRYVAAAGRAASADTRVKWMLPSCPE